MAAGRPRGHKWPGESEDPMHRAGVSAAHPFLFRITVILKSSGDAASSRPSPVVAHLLPLRSCPHLVLLTMTLARTNTIGRRTLIPTSSSPTTTSKPLSPLLPIAAALPLPRFSSSPTPSSLPSTGPAQTQRSIFEDLRSVDRQQAIRLRVQGPADRPLPGGHPSLRQYNVLTRTLAPPSLCPQ